MALISWSDSMSVGVTKIDGEHRKLIDLINQLHGHMMEGKSNEVMGKVLDSLIGYTKTHFAAEEALFRVHKYPQAGEHKQEHDALTKKVLELQAEFKAGKALISAPVLGFLRDWLTQHIMKVDMSYRVFFADKGVR